MKVKCVGLCVGGVGFLFFWGGGGGGGGGANWPWRILLPQTFIYCYYLDADFKHTADVIYYTTATTLVEQG